MLYINNLPDDITSTVKLYADDVLLYRSIDSIQDSIALQQDLNTLQDWANKWLMVFNPTKCELIRITNKRNRQLSDYYIQNTLIKANSQAKYLGVTIDEHLIFNDHIKNIANKANTVRAFLQRNLKSCPKSIKESCYKIMVRPIVEYANTVWSPYTKQNISLLEAVQRRAARFVFREFLYSSSVTSMLQKLGWPTLEQRRWISKAIMLYKILNNLVAIPADKYTTPNNNCTRGHPQRLKTVSCHTNVFLHSFSHQR